MGIAGLLKELPGGPMSEALAGFSQLTELQDKNNPADFDAGTLKFICALRHKAPYLTGNYLPAVSEFQRQLIVLQLVYDWNFTCILDGVSPIEKQHEHSRRQEKEDRIEIKSTYIAMCAKVCDSCFIPYVVSPLEADMQVGRRREGTIAITRDSDLIAYGHKRIIMIDDYRKEEYRVINMDTALTDEVAQQFPLYSFYKKYGIKIIHWWAAVMGCDISVEDCGIRDAGKKGFLKALHTFDGKDPDVLTSYSFAGKLRDNSRVVCSVDEIKDELDRVANWFSEKGTYYDELGNVHSITGHEVKAATKGTVRHMKGDLDPKTHLEFTEEQKKQLSYVQCHNLLQNSAAPRESIKGVSLPSGRTTINSCTVDELKAMVIARGGSVTGRDGKAHKQSALRKIVRAWLNLEKENTKHAVYFQRSRHSNGIFANIDTSERRTIPQILNTLANSTEHEEPLKIFFCDIKRYYTEDKFTDDFDTICLEAPELTEDFIRQSFIHVGESTRAKNIVSSLHRVLELDEIIYHAIAQADDGKSIYIISKQRASQKHDEKTRKETEVGEKPKFAEYLVMVQLMMQPTTDAVQGHTLGTCVCVMRSYCAACKAGLGFCYHRAGLLWMQHLHWGEGRPTPKPPTANFCSWIKGMRSKRNCSTIQPASRLQRERLPASNAEAKQKIDRGIKKSMHEGIPANYDVHCGHNDKKAKLNDPNYTSFARCSPLFKLLRESQLNGTLDDEGV